MGFILKLMSIFLLVKAFAGSQEAEVNCTFLKGELCVFLYSTLARADSSFQKDTGIISAMQLPCQVPLSYLVCSR